MDVNVADTDTKGNAAGSIIMMKNVGTIVIATENVAESTTTTASVAANRENEKYFWKHIHPDHVW